MKKKPTKRRNPFALPAKMRKVKKFKSKKDYKRVKKVEVE
jgi:hypothetical protein